mmetsp:Transcript_42655/g.106753  ORF Transcript_42655/g.106753 Transcript_42655/m.106753 type:complete len:100 (+) Transcript_42655:64-363(+)
MGVSKDIPKYPCIYPNPSFTEVTKNFRADDFKIIAMATLASIPYGYFAGTARLPQMRVPSMLMSGIIGLHGGFFIAYQQSGGRLMGRLANDAEVRELMK